MKLVIIESPFAGDTETNIDYARAAVKDSLRRGEAPIASHLLYTQPGILDDTVPAERQQGIAAGLAWGHHAAITAVYIDHGITRGMAYGMMRAANEGRHIELRMIEPLEKAARNLQTSEWTHIFPDVTSVEVIDGNGILHRATSAGPAEVIITNNGRTLRVTHNGETERHFQGHP